MPKSAKRCKRGGAGLVCGGGSCSSCWLRLAFPTTLAGLASSGVLTRWIGSWPQGPARRKNSPAKSRCTPPARRRGTPLRGAVRPPNPSPRPRNTRHGPENPSHAGVCSVEPHGLRPPRQSLRFVARRPRTAALRESVRTCTTNRKCPPCPPAGRGAQGGAFLFRFVAQARPDFSLANSPPPPAPPQGGERGSSFVRHAF